jgi:hypothetical protein
MNAAGPRRGAAALATCAAAIAACGAGPPAARVSPPGVPHVTLVLHRDSGDKQLLACSLVHHYAQFPAGRLIAFDGAVIPPPQEAGFKIKVKIKRCVDGRFEDSGAWNVRGSADGRFRGALQIPGKGVFFGRARYRSPKGTALSDKFYFEVS